MKKISISILVLMVMLLLFIPCSFATTKTYYSVDFKFDTENPAVVLIGFATVALECGSFYSDAGATATDICDGDLTTSIMVSGDTVDTAVPGFYIITYNVSDTALNTAVEVTRIVTVQDNCVEGEPVEGEPVEGEGETDPCDPDTGPPVIIRCASSQTVVADVDGVTLVPEFADISATDTCTLAGSGLTHTQSPAAGTQVGIGEHDVTITISDETGNTTSCTAVLTVTPWPWRFGDANLDGNITQSDITEIMRLIAGTDPVGVDALVTADIDRNGIIEESDMLALFSFIRSGGIVTEIPQNLMAHSGVDEIILLWGPVPHDNVHGYIVERKVQSNTTATYLPEASDPIYYDQNIESVEYTYRVAVIDVLGNVEAFSESVMVLGNTLVLWAPWAQGLAGDEVIAPIAIGSTRGLNPKNVSITINYDPEVAEFQGLLTTVLSKPLSYLEPEYTPGQITLIARAPQGQLPVGEGRFFDLRMKLKADAPDGCQETLISDIIILNSDSEGITTATVPGAICVGDVPWGDLNGDGTINVADAQLALEIVVRNMMPTSEQLFRGDLNGDRRIDAADAVLILRLGGGLSLNPEQDEKSLENKTFSSRQVSLPSTLSIPKGCSAVVPVRVDNAGSMAGMDLVISYTRADLRCDAVCPSPATSAYEFMTDLGTGYVRLSFSAAMALPEGETILAYLIVTAIGDETLEGVRPTARIRINYAELKGELGESFRWYGDIMRQDAAVTILKDGDCEEVPDCEILSGEGEGEDEGEGEPLEGETTEGEEEGEDSVEGEGESLTLEDIAQMLLDQFETADTNGGGWLGFYEAQAVVPSLSREQFDSMDTNGDSYLTRTELLDILAIDEGCGCCKRTSDTKENFKRHIGDWLLLGLTLLVLLNLPGKRKIS